MVKDQNGKDRRFIELVSYDEVYPEHKTEHFRRIRGYNNEPYKDMVTGTLSSSLSPSLKILFPDFIRQNESEYQSRDDARRHVPALSQWADLVDLPGRAGYLASRKFIGYSGMDLDTIELLEKGGRRHDRKEAARWGYAMYVADDPRVARYFSDWIKATAFGPQAKTIVCEIYARDGDKWDQMNKIWVPDHRHDLKTDVNRDELTVATSELKRDQQVAAWGVRRPYVLFSRHPNMGRRDGLQFPIPNPQRFNEMVIYGQTQENLIVINRMTDAQLDQAIKNKANLSYEHQIPEWNIKVPEQTKADFLRHRERPTLRQTRL
ncbi:hypothetical protein PQX77_009060 [Marasmius sp. AFHP31]|nr:hypothetical protein PQX77_009060 [Marasmius sp. AFHP31]